jgi:CubicO group peptidase (beta-lactamase class C family)
VALLCQTFADFGGLMRQNVRSLLFMFCVSFASSSLSQSSPSEIDSYVTRAMKTFNAPGFALAIVKNGKVTYAKGYGVRRIGESAPVDDHTLFFIGSTSKAFTAAALATLVDDGNFKWDEPIRTYLPWFELYDVYASHEVTARDLLSHRSGIGTGQGDLLFLPDTDLSSHDIALRMKLLKPFASFRSQHNYCNVCVISASEVIPALTGQSWESYLQSRIFVPLGMTSTRTSAAELSPDENIASSHDFVRGKLQPVDWTDIPAARPAGGIISNVADVSKWIIVQLNRGQLPQSDKRLFSEQQSREMWTGASFPTDWPAPLVPGMEVARWNFSEYGLGWYLYDYRGARIVEHGGAANQSAEIVLMPDQNAGFVLLSNSAISTAAEIDAVMKYLMDSLLDVPYVDWISKDEAALKNQLYAAEHQVQEAAAQRDKSSQPSLPLKKYAGTYHDPWYGDIQLSFETGKLVFRSAHSTRMVGDLEHWQHDVFIVHWEDSLVPDAYVYFALKPDATIDNFKMKAVSSRADFSFDFQDLVFSPGRVPPK